MLDPTRSKPSSGTTCGVTTAGLLFFMNLMAKKKLIVNVYQDGSVGTRRGYLPQRWQRRCKNENYDLWTEVKKKRQHGHHVPNIVDPAQGEDEMLHVFSEIKIVKHCIIV